MFILKHLLLCIETIRSVVNFATHTPVITRAIGGVRFMAMLPVLIPVRLHGYMGKLWCHSIRSYHSQIAVLVLSRIRNVAAPIVWNTRYKVICRQFSRLTP